MRSEKVARGGTHNLVNGGSLALLWIGVGGAFAEKHYHTNLLVVKGQTHLAIDCGMTFNQALFDSTGLRPTDIHSILPTHSHPDHIGSLADFALRHRYPGVRFMGKAPPRLIVTDEYERELWEQSLRGGLEMNEQKADGTYLTLSDYFQVLHPTLLPERPRRTYQIDFEGIRLELFRTNHIPDNAPTWREAAISYGVLFLDERVLVSVDTKFDPEMLGLYADRAEVIFHDVQFFEGGVHAPFSELNKLPPQIKKKTYLIHYADDYRKRDITGFGGWAEQGARYLFEN